MNKSANLPRRRAFAGALALLALLAAPARADEDDRHDRDRRDHDRARRALERGEVLPLERILAAVRAHVPGEILGVELEREHGAWIYEVRVVDASGRRLVVYVDGAKATILKVKGR
ncbi:MAG: PepSY domain-containing protein [Rhodospirillaceae bacterium]|nr:PepSY domain-containing protein [Rhodospirillaceae bacterium]